MNIAAFQALGARQDIGSDGGISMPDMRFTIDIIDGCGHVICWAPTHFLSTLSNTLNITFTILTMEKFVKPKGGTSARETYPGL